MTAWLKKIQIAKTINKLSKAIELTVDTQFDGPSSQIFSFGPLNSRSTKLQAFKIFERKKF